MKPASEQHGAHWSLDDLELARQRQAQLYHEFVQRPELSAGLYVLEAGATDPQGPHSEDELYVILSGQGRIRVGGQDFAVQTGDTVFVPAQLEHKFHSIQETLRVIVVFGPAEHSRRA